MAKERQMRNLLQTSPSSRTACWWESRQPSNQSYRSMNLADTTPRFHSQPKQKQKIGWGLRGANSNLNKH
jgi:hypothetical protein